MKRTTIFIDEALELDVEALARRLGLSKAAVVREALTRYVGQEKGRISADPSFVAVGRSGRSDVADRHEEILFEDLEPHDPPEAADPIDPEGSGRIDRSRDHEPPG